MVLTILLTRLTAASSPHKCISLAHSPRRTRVHAPPRSMSLNIWISSMTATSSIQRQTHGKVKFKLTIYRKLNSFMGRQRRYFWRLFIFFFTYILWWCWSSRQYRIREPPACQGQNGGVSPLQWSDHMAHSENDIANNSKYSWFWFCWKKVNSKFNILITIANNG